MNNREGAKSAKTDATKTNISLRAYWRGAGLWLVFLGVYLAVIFALGTETSRLTTAPPWYSWVRDPLRHRAGSILYLAMPVLVFAVWRKIAGQIAEKPLLPGGMMMVSCAAVFVMNVSVALMDGGMWAIWKPFDRAGSEYFGDVHWVGGVGEFLRTYVERLHLYGVHTQTHPPGAVLFLYFVKCAFGPGVQSAAWAAVIVTATAVIPFYLLARDLGGERMAAAAVAIYSLVPSLVLFGATSMDGVFLVPLMWSMFLMQRMIVKPRIANALAAAIALTVSLMMSYVTVCVGVMMAIYGLLEVRRRPWTRAGAGLACGLLIVCFLWLIYLASGFNYVRCFEASRYFDHYLMHTFGLSLGRYLDISFANLVAFLIGMGLPVVVLWWEEFRHLDKFGVAGCVAIVGFSFAKLFTRETERIWLFFAPVAILAAANAIVRSGANERRVLNWAMGLLFVQTWVFQLLLYTIW